MNHKYIVLFFLLSSCTSNYLQKDPMSMFNEKHYLTGELLNVEANKLNSYGRMILFDNDCLIKENLRGEYLLEKIFYDRDSIVPIAFKGNGPNEYLHLSLIQKKDRESYLVFDVFKKAVYTHDLLENISDTVKFEQPVFHIASIKDRYVANSFHSDSRYSVFDCFGKLNNSFGEFPDDGINIPLKRKHFAYQGLMASNDSLGCIVSISYSGTIMEFYKLEESNAKPIRLLHQTFPLYEDASTNKITSVRHKKDNIFGYVDICSSTKYIYALYSGKQVASQIEGQSTEKVRRCKQILVYDWEGNPKYILNTDKELMNIAVSDNDSYLIALGWDDDYKLYRFDLP